MPLLKRFPGLRLRVTRYDRVDFQLSGRPFRAESASAAHAILLVIQFGQCASGDQYFAARRGIRDPCGDVDIHPEVVPANPSRSPTVQPDAQLWTILAVGDRADR